MDYKQKALAYPFYHAARLLYAQELFRSHSADFHAELKRTALSVPRREVLYDMIEGDALKPADISRKPKRKYATDELVDQFLEGVPEDKKKRPRTADPRVDYLEYLRQTQGEHGLKPAAKTSEAIDSWLEKEGRITLQDRNEDDMLKPLAEQSREETSSGVLTETMARIYIKQQKYDQALEIIRKLSLRHPQKNRYFADQMRFLEKVIRNESNSKTK